MATEDISRNATSLRKRYAGVRLQQGRVSTDDDYNEGARIDAEETRRTLIDVIGPSGSADGGFSISHPRINGHGDLDFSIGAGTLYLGGLRLECFGEDYTEQSDWLEQLPADRAAAVDGRTEFGLSDGLGPAGRSDRGFRAVRDRSWRPRHSYAGPPDAAGDAGDRYRRRGLRNGLVE